MEQIKDSVIDCTAKLFSDVRVVNSSVGKRCCIGDACDIEDSVLDDTSELGRRNLLRKVKLGKGSYTGTNTIIKETEIGRYTSISWNVSVGGGDHNYGNVSMYTDYWYHRTFGIEVEPRELPAPGITAIGNDVWIGNGAIINSGITIGDGCVIGAGTVITKDVPPYSIVVGVPGKVIKKGLTMRSLLCLKK